MGAQLERLKGLKVFVIYFFEGQEGGGVGVVWPKRAVARRPPNGSVIRNAQKILPARIFRDTFMVPAMRHEESDRRGSSISFFSLLFKLRSASFYELPHKSYSMSRRQVFYKLRRLITFPEEEAENYGEGPGQSATSLNGSETAAGRHVSRHPRRGGASRCLVRSHQPAGSPPSPPEMETASGRCLRLSLHLQASRRESISGAASVRFQGRKRWDLWSRAFKRPTSAAQTTCLI